MTAARGDDADRLPGRLATGPFRIRECAGRVVNRQFRSNPSIRKPLNKLLQILLPAFGVCGEVVAAARPGQESAAWVDGSPTTVVAALGIQVRGVGEFTGGLASGRLQRHLGVVGIVANAKLDEDGGGAVLVMAVDRHPLGESLDRLADERTDLARQQAIRVLALG